MPAASSTLHFVAVGSRLVAYTDLPGHLPPVLLIHGAGASSRNWADVPVAVNSLGYRVVTVDLPGHGASSTGPGDYSIEALREAVVAVLDECGIEHVHLVGHSLGGGVAMGVVDLGPHRVRSLTLVSSGGLGDTAGALLRATSLPLTPRAMPLVVNRTTISALCSVSRLVARSGRELVPATVLEVLSDLAEPAHRQAFLDTLAPLVTRDGQVRSGVPALSFLDPSQVLFVTCESDPVIPAEHSFAAHEALPGSSLVVVKGRSHEPHTHGASQFVGALSEHLAR